MSWSKKISCKHSQVTTALSPFTVTSSTLKKDTRARGRFLNIKIENDAASESWRFGTLKLDLQQMVEDND